MHGQVQVEGFLAANSGSEAGGVCLELFENRTYPPRHPVRTGRASRPEQIEKTTFGTHGAAGAGETPDVRPDLPLSGGRRLHQASHGVLSIDLAEVRRPLIMSRDSAHLGNCVYDRSDLGHEVHHFGIDPVEENYREKEFDNKGKHCKNLKKIPLLKCRRKPHYT